MFQLVVYLCAMKEEVDQDNEDIPLRKIPSPPSDKRNRAVPNRKLFNNAAINNRNPVKRMLAIIIGLGLVAFLVWSLKQAGMKVNFSKKINVEQSSGELKTEDVKADAPAVVRAPDVSTNIVLLPPPSGK